MTTSKKALLLTPLFGILLFVLLYIVATRYYPGGSQVDKHSIGFSWLNNYWCNLLNDQAINGQSNAAKPIAMTAMLILCLALIVFWFLFPTYVPVSSRLAITIKSCGSLAMITGSLLFTTINHDLVINTACFFGVVAVIGIVAGLHKIRWVGLFVLGLVNFLLVGVNNVVYYTKGLIIYLPVIQKITFALFLFWICLIDVYIYAQKINHHAQINT